MAHHLSIIRLLQHGSFPELIRHLLQTQRGEELLSNTKHVCGIIALGKGNNISAILQNQNPLKTEKELNL